MLTLLTRTKIFETIPLVGFYVDFSSKAIYLRYICQVRSQVVGHVKVVAADVDSKLALVHNLYMDGFYKEV